jgi:VWFA-related protein
MRLAAARVLLPALFLCPVPPGAAQPQKPQDLPVFGTGVHVVAVPVFVTDKSGRAVAGLTAADFEIEDEKHRVPIVAFEAVDATAPVTPAPGASVLMQAASRRQFLILFDLTFSTPAGVMRARDAAIKLVRTALAPGDLAAVATFSQSGIRVLVGFTPDREQVALAIRGLGLREPPERRDPLSLAWDLGLDLGPGTPRSGSDTSGRSGELEAFLEDQRKLFLRSQKILYHQRVDAFLDGLSQLGSMLSGLQGRKHVLLLSAGFDQTVLQAERGMDQRESAQAVVEGRIWDVQSERYFGDATARSLLKQVFDALAASDTVIHTVDVTGLSAGGSVGTADDPPRPIDGSREPTSGRDTLALLANNTGGRFVHDANDLVAGLREVLDATRYYYVLAFEPADDRVTGKLRKLTVDVKGKGLSVSHRAGYVLPDPAHARDSASWRVQAAETIAKGLTGGALVLRAVAVPYRNENGDTRLPVVLQIDGRSLSAAGGRELKLQIYGYALDGAGRIRDVLALSSTFDLAKVGASLRAQGLQVITSFAVREGSADLRFLVRDVVSGRAGSLRSQVLVPSFEGKDLALSPPLFVDDPRTRLVVPAASRANPTFEIPFRLAERAFTPDAWPTLARGRGREVCVLAWSGTRGAERPPYDVRAELVGAEGSRAVDVTGSVRTVADADGFTRFVLSVDPGSAGAGEQVLRVSFSDPATGTVKSTETPVRVE